MKKSILLGILVLGFALYTTGQAVFAVEYKSSEDTTTKSEYIGGYEFHKTPQETIAKMKSNLNSNKNSMKVNSITGQDVPISSLIAKAFDVAGFNNTANLLNYSMLPLRVEPKEFDYTSNFSSDIWTYSPEFRNVVGAFLNGARSKGSYEYFSTTTMNFNMPSESKAQILSNINLKKRADLFGALHAVTINLGIVKTGFQWDMLVLIEDVYDFKLEQYNSLLNIVNNIAYYDQERGNVRPYNLYIYADRPYLSSPPLGVPAW